MVGVSWCVLLYGFVCVRYSFVCLHHNNLHRFKMCYWWCVVGCWYFTEMMTEFGMSAVACFAKRKLTNYVYCKWSRSVLLFSRHHAPALTAFFNGFSHKISWRFFEIVCPSNFCEQLNPESGDVEMMCQFSRLVVPWKYVMIIVPAFAHGNNRYAQIFNRIYFSVWNERESSNQINFHECNVTL